MIIFGYKKITATASTLKLEPDGTPGATLSLNVADGLSTYIIDGTATLTSSLTITTTGTPVEGLQALFFFQGGLTLGANNFTFFGYQLSAVEALKGCVMYAYYDGSSWQRLVLPRTDATEWIETDDIKDGAVTDGKVASGIDGSKLSAGTVPGTALAASSITNSQLAVMPTLTIKGNNTGGNSVPIDLTVAQVWTMLGGQTWDASGTASVSNTGGGNTVTGNYSIAVGQNNNVSGDHAGAIGRDCIASADYSLALGYDAGASRIGEIAKNNVSTALKRQEIEDIMSALTTDATPTTLQVGGAAAFNIPNNTVVAYKLHVLASQDGGTAGTVGDTASWEIKGTIKNLSGTTSMEDDVLYLSSGRILPREQGTAQAGGANSITLQASAPVGDNRFICAEIYILSGTGAGQTNYITSYNGTTKVAAVQNTWGVIPDNTSVYRIVTQDSKNANTISWDVNVVANNGTDTLDVTCTGEANKNIVWYCTLEGIEILLS
jgi:hypothetical protein